MKLIGEIQLDPLTACRTVRYNEAMCGLLRSSIQSWPIGQLVDVEIKKRKPHHSNQQIRAWWGMIMPFMRQVAQDQGWDFMGIPLCDEQLKQILYHFCGNVGDDGERVRMSKANVEQMSLFFENCRNWLANFGMVVPEPDVNWRQNKTDKDWRENKAFAE